VISAGSASDGWNYMGTDGGGVARFNYSEVDGVTGETIMDIDWAGLMSNNINDIFIKDTSQLYGTDDGFSYHAHHETKKNWDIIISSLDEKLPDNEVLSVFIDSEENFWIGTANGLTSFKDASSDDWDVYTTDDGLLSNEILDIAEDVNGNLWFGTDKGISYYERNEVGIKDLDGYQVTDLLNLRISPSPVSSVANIEFETRRKSSVSIDIYNISGQHVKNIQKDHLNQGKYKVEWNLRDNNGEKVSTGIYLVRLATGDVMSFKKMVVIRK
jgi:ligand-binding sensor domain-containing protein